MKNSINKLILIFFVGLFIFNQQIAFCVDNTVYQCLNPAVTELFISSSDCNNGCSPNYYSCLQNNQAYKDQITCLSVCGGVNGTCSRELGTMDQYTCNCTSCDGKGVQTLNDKKGCEDKCTEPVWECGLDHLQYETSALCSAGCNNTFKGECTKKMVDVTTFVCPTNNTISNIDISACNALCSQAKFTCPTGGVVYLAENYGGSSVAAETACNTSCLSGLSHGQCTSSTIAQTKWTCPNDSANPKTQFDTKATCESSKCTSQIWTCTLAGTAVNGTTYTSQAACDPLLGGSCKAGVSQGCNSVTYFDRGMNSIFICPTDAAGNLIANSRSIPGHLSGNAYTYLTADGKEVAPYSYYSTTSMADCNAHCQEKPDVFQGQYIYTPYEIRTGHQFQWGTDLATCNKSNALASCWQLRTGANRPTLAGQCMYSGGNSASSCYAWDWNDQAIASTITPNWIATPTDPVDNKYAIFSNYFNGYLIISSQMYTGLAACQNALTAYLANSTDGNPIYNNKTTDSSWGVTAAYRNCTGGVLTSGTGCVDGIQVNLSIGSYSNKTVYTCSDPSIKEIWQNSANCTSHCTVQSNGTCGSSNVVTPCTSIAVQQYAGSVTCIYPEDTRNPGSLNNTTYSGNGSEAADVAACNAACQATLPNKCSSGTKPVDCTPNVVPTYMGYECKLGTSTILIGGMDATQDALDCDAQCKTSENGGCVPATKKIPCTKTEIEGYIGYNCSASHVKTYLGITNSAGAIDELLDFHVCQASCVEGTENCVLHDSQSSCTNRNQTTVWECMNPATIGFFNTQDECNTKCEDGYYRCLLDKTTYTTENNCNKFCAIKSPKDCIKINQSGMEYSCSVLDFKSFDLDLCNEHCTQPGFTCITSLKQYAQDQEALCLTECGGVAHGTCETDKENWYVCPMDNTIKFLDDMGACQKNCLRPTYTCNSSNTVYTDLTAQNSTPSFPDGLTQCNTECDGKIPGECTPQTASEDQWTCSTDTNTPKMVFNESNKVIGKTAAQTCRDSCFKTVWKCSLPGAAVYNPITKTGIDQSPYDTQAACDPTQGGACKLSDSCINVSFFDQGLNSIFICPTDAAGNLIANSRSIPGHLSGNAYTYLTADGKETAPYSYYSNVSMADCNAHCQEKPEVSQGQQIYTPYEIRIGQRFQWGTDLATCNKSNALASCWQLRTGANRPTLAGQCMYSGGNSASSCYAWDGNDQAIANTITPNWIATSTDPVDNQYAIFSNYYNGYVIVSSQMYTGLTACQNALTAYLANSTDGNPIYQNKTTDSGWGITAASRNCSGGVLTSGTGCVDGIQVKLSPGGFKNKTIYDCSASSIKELWVGSTDCGNHCPLPIYGSCADSKIKIDCDNTPLVTYTGTLCTTEDGSLPGGTIYNDPPGDTAANAATCKEHCYKQITAECTKKDETVPCDLQPDYHGVDCKINDKIGIDDVTGDPLHFYTDPTSEANDKLLCAANCSQRSNLCLPGDVNVVCDKVMNTGYSGYVCQQDYAVYNTGDDANDKNDCNNGCFTIAEQGKCERQHVSPNQKCIEIKLETPKCTAINESDTATFECQSDNQEYKTADECLEHCTTSSGACDLYNHPVACITNQDSSGNPPGTSKCAANGLSYHDLQSCIDNCNTEMECINGTGKCPMGSAYECVDAGKADTYTDKSNPDLLTSYANDPGEVDGATGNCLGQIYLFNGKPMTCNKPGLQTSWKNCCKADADVVSGIKQQMALVKTMEALKTVKELYSLTTTAMEAYKMIQIVGAPIGYAADASNVAWAMYGADAGLEGSAIAGSALTQSMNTMFLNPSTIAVAAALYVVEELFSKSCTSQDVMTASLNDIGMCHYNGEKCTKEIDLIAGSWCAQRTKFYCCFNSKTARVIHEQGRPQLQNIKFGELGGNACRGFTPEEFAMLDFSQIDMSEIFGDIQTKMPDVNALQNDAQSRAQQSVAP